MNKTGIMLVGLALLVARAASADDEPSAGPDRVAQVAATLCTDPPFEVLTGLFDPKRFPEPDLRRVKALLGTLGRKHGPCESTRVKAPSAVEYVHKQAIIPGRLHLDETGRIVGLWFAAPLPTRDGWPAIGEALSALPGAAAVTVVREGGERLLSVAGERPLAVGSSFKLQILRALQDSVDRGASSWSQVVRLRPEQRSFPTGLLQDWPIGAPVTLHTLATLMMSRSDNTATDHLIHFVGADAIERDAGPPNRPFLTTLQVFKLKSPGARALAERYAAGAEAARRAVLAELVDFPRDRVEISARPTFVEQIEWFYSTDALCELVLALKTLDVLTVNSGLAERERFARVAYKGGSEPGVLNRTHALQDRDSGRWTCISATWNRPDEPLDRAAFDRLVVRMIHLAAKPDSK